MDHDQYNIVLGNKRCGIVQSIAHVFEHCVFCSSISSLSNVSKPYIFNHVT